jgi:hypothetical protein
LSAQNGIAGTNTVSLADIDTYEVCLMCNKEFEDGWSSSQATICETCKAEFKQMRQITQAILKLNFLE